MFFAYPLFKDSKKTENGPWDKQYCSGKLIHFANTTGGAICRIFMKWQLICACRKKDLYLWKIMHLWLAQTVASLESGSDTSPTRATFQKKGSTLISVSVLKEKTAKHPTANRRACRR